MYNRYIPGSNGVYERKTVGTPKEEKTQCREVQPVVTVDTCAEQTTQPAPCCRKWLPQGVDLGDLLLLCIVLLLLIDSEEDDMLPLLVAAAVLLFS
jgi:hypothetical protein